MALWVNSTGPRPPTSTTLDSTSARLAVPRPRAPLSRFPSHTHTPTRQKRTTPCTAVLTCTFALQVCVFRDDDHDGGTLRWELPGAVANADALALPVPGP
eukprot:scaffold105614_cov72-Phaeocystis_antarctica.AAC.1